MCCFLQASCTAGRQGNGGAQRSGLLTLCVVYVSESRAISNPAIKFLQFFADFFHLHF